ncbi:ankyrin repeat domain-containing protein SOWAHA [Pelodytes ibericus]
MAVKQEDVLNFLLEEGGSVKNSDLLRKFRSVVDSPDPQVKANNRELFKTFVNNIARVKDVEGVKVVVLRKKCFQLMPSDTHPEEVRNTVPSSQDDHNGTLESLQSNQTRYSQKDIPGDKETVSAKVMLQNNEMPLEDSGVGKSADLGNDPGNTTEENLLVSSDDTEDNEIKRVSVFDIVSRIDNTGPVPVPKAWEKGGGQSKEPAQKPFMLPLRYAQTSFEETEDQEEIHFKQPSSGNTFIHETVPLAQPRSPHVIRKPLDDTGSRSPYTKRTSKYIKVSEENKYSDVVPLEPSDHIWLVNTTTGRWNHILLGLLINDNELADKRDFISGFTALHWAAKSGNTEMVKILFDMAHSGGTNLNVNVKSYGGYTPLHIAAIHDHKEVIMMLVRDYNAKVHIRDHSGRKPYQYLKKGCSLKIRCLLNDPHAISTEQPFPIKRNSKVAASLLGTTSALLGVLSDDIPFHDLAKGLKKPSSLNKFFTAPTGPKKKVKGRDRHPSITSLYEEAGEEAEEPVGKRRPASEFFSHS